MNLLTVLKSRFCDALAALADDPSEFVELVRPSTDPKFGDYQANCAMPLAKRLARPPREIAAEIVGRLNVADLCQAPEIAGPGFINLRIKEDWLAAQLAAALADEARLGIAPVAAPRTYVVDYSAPNVAKPMHVGHIRSTVIGAALYNILKFVGHTAIGDNHIGDWGTQFGMIIHGWKHFRDEAAYRADPVAELARLYRHVNGLGESVMPDVLAETAKLHAGDPENHKLWQEFLPACLAEIEAIYQRLGVRFDVTHGESFYQDRLRAVVDDLRAKNLAVESEGATCVFLEGFEQPMLVQKRDGAFLYSTSDLATIQYRVATWRPDAILYVVDHRQSLYFQQLFAAARLWGYTNVELTHVAFGTVLGSDNRPFKTRSGDTVGLAGLLDEAESRALAIVSENDDAKPEPELSPDERQRIARIVGIGALKYADLCQNRTSDYVFSYDKMLATKGNTATYMQYAYARVRSIFRKGNIDAEVVRSSRPVIQLAHPAERALAIGLLSFSEALDMTLVDYRPNQLTSYLFELANRYSTFFENCPVLKAETEAARVSRLALCDLTARTLKLGLELLGIEVVEKM